MRKFIVVSALILMMSAFIFGFGIELGAGVNNMMIFLNFPTVAAGVNVPIAGNFSLTGQFDALFPLTSGSNPSFMALGGGRYTFDMKNMKLFVGADGGILTNFTSGSNMYPVFGFNGGVQFQMFYIKGAMRWPRVNIGQPSYNTTNVFVSLNELTAGINWAF